MLTSLRTKPIRSFFKAKFRYCGFIFNCASSKQHNSQTIRARELKFLENVHPPTMCQMLHVMCHVSQVTYHVSHVTSQVTHFKCHFFFFFLLLFSLTRWWSQSVEGLLSMGLTPASLHTEAPIFYKYMNFHCRAFKLQNYNSVTL